MRTGHHVASGLLLAVALLGASCEDSDLTAPGDGSITVNASSGTVVIDPNNPNSPRDPISGLRSGSTTVFATVFDKDGNALEGVSVSFSTTGGRIESATVPGQVVSSVVTDSTGTARAKLVLTENDPDEVEVTARSSALTGKATVKLTVVGQNERPSAGIRDTPTGEQLVGHDVVFDGTISVDPDDDPLTMYRWRITSDNPDPGQPVTEIVEGPSVFALERRYQNPQNLTVSLEVTDDPQAPLLFAAGEPVPYDDQEIIQYEITCDNPPPVANAGPDQTIPFPNGIVNVILDGSGSFDGETEIATYNWDCGNGTAPEDLGAGVVLCKYSAPATYKATLTVTDKGTGVIDLGTGRFECEKSDTDDTNINIPVQQ